MSNYQQRGNLQQDLVVQLWAKIGPKIRFFVIFLKFGSLVFLEIAQNDSLEHCLTTRRGKTHGKNFERPKLWVQNQGFCNFLKVASLYFLNIAQDCSLGQCLTSSRAETSKEKKNCGPNFFYSNLVKHPLKLACLYYPRFFTLQTKNLNTTRIPTGMKQNLLQCISSRQDFCQICQVIKHQPRRVQYFSVIQKKLFNDDRK